MGNDEPVIAHSQMANPAYWRSPFGAVKRLKISPSQFAPRSSCIARQQQAGLADVRDLPPQSLSTPEELAQQPKVVNEVVSAQQGQELAPSKSQRQRVPSPPGFDHLGTLDPRTKELLYNMDLPPNVQAVYLRPLRRAATHGIPVCDLQLRSYSIRNLEFFADFAMRAAYYLGLPAKGPVPLPQITERWTVPRGPFVHKKSQENFERKTLRRLIQIQDGHAEVVQAWLAYLEKRAYYGVGMKANVWEWEDFDVAKKMDENLTKHSQETEEMFANFGVRRPQGAKELDEEAWQDILEQKDDVRRYPKEIAR